MKHILKKINTIFSSALKMGRSPTKIAISFGIGIFIAFSPLIGFHMIMVICLSFLLKLDAPIVLFASLFNNPITAIPFYSFDYFVGYWILHDIFKINPDWFISLEKIFGTGKICIISFLVGGHIVSLILGFLSYSIAKFSLQKLIIPKLGSKYFMK